MLAFIEEFRRYMGRVPTPREITLPFKSLSENDAGERLRKFRVVK